MIFLWSSAIVLLMFAVIKTGGKQYIVSPGQKLKIEKIDAKENGAVVFDQILLSGEGEEVIIGTPMVTEVRVQAKVLNQGRHRKLIVFKYRHKTRYRKMRGHRQPFTEVEIQKIEK